jgi:transcriptional regulator with XRE-family HTH domain
MLNSPDPAANLAMNLKQLRRLRGVTQQQLAHRAGVPRPTLATLETGDGNPTLRVLMQIAAALDVSLEELVGPPRDTGRLYRAEEIARTTRAGVEITQVLPDKVPGIQAERLALPPGAAMRGVPHTPGTREYLRCEAGTITLTASGSSWTLAPGDVVVFRGDQRHAYRNPGELPAVGWSILVAP